MCPEKCIFAKKNYNLELMIINEPFPNKILLLTERKCVGHVYSNIKEVCGALNLFQMNKNLTFENWITVIMIEIMF